MKIGVSILAGLGAITPVGWIVIGTVVVTSAVVISVQYAKSKSKGKSKQEVDRYARLEQKSKGENEKPRRDKVKTGYQNLIPNNLKSILQEEIIENIM